MSDPGACRRLYTRTDRGESRNRRSTGRQSGRAEGAAAVLPRPLTVYGEPSRITAPTLAREAATFKQTPYEVKSRTLDYGWIRLRHMKARHCEPKAKQPRPTAPSLSGLLRCARNCLLEFAIQLETIRALLSDPWRRQSLKDPTGRAAEARRVTAILLATAAAETTGFWPSLGKTTGAGVGRPPSMSAPRVPA